MPKMITKYMQTKTVSTKPFFTLNSIFELSKVQHRMLFLDISGAYNEGCAAFASVSPNVVADESVMKTDEGMTMEQRYTVVRLACFVLEIFSFYY